MAFTGELMIHFDNDAHKSIIPVTGVEGVLTSLCCFFPPLNLRLAKDLMSVLIL